MIDAVPPAGLRMVMSPRRRPSPDYYIYNKTFLFVIRTVDAILSIRRLFCRTPAVPPRPARILISNCADFGDIVLLLPMLQAVRKMFPDAQIGFLSGVNTAAVVAGTGLVDRLHRAEGRLVAILKREQGWRRVSAIYLFFARRLAVARELRAARYDVALDCYLFPFPAAPLLYLAGIPVRAGFVSGGFGPLLTHALSPGPVPRPIIERPGDLLAMLWPERAAGLEPLAPCYPGHPLPSVTVRTDEQPYWVVHMGTGAAYKEWPEAHWRGLLANLATRGGTLWLTGSGGRERERIDRMVAELALPSVRAYPDCSWAEFVAVVAGAEHVVCLDSAIAHVAAAFKVPTTALYTGTHDLREWRPKSDVCEILINPVACMPCNRQDCAEMACLAELAPAVVLSRL